MSDITDLVDPVIRAFTTQLETTIAGHATTVYLKGSVEMIAWGKINRPGVKLPFEGPPMKQAIRYAQTRSARMVKGIDDVTRDRLANVISNAIKNKRGVPGLARDIRQTFADMARHRPVSIARTETATALEQSFMDRSKDLGVTGKRWITVGDAQVTPECEANAAEAVVALDHVFSSGDARPPVHPNCRCALAPVMLEAS